MVLKLFLGRVAVGERVTASNLSKFVNSERVPFQVRLDKGLQFLFHLKDPIDVKIGGHAGN